MNLSKIPDKRQGWEDSVFLIVYCVPECQKEGVLHHWCISRTTEWFSSPFSEPHKPSNLDENAGEETNLLHMSTSTLMRYLLKGKNPLPYRHVKQICSFPTVSIHQYFQPLSPSSIQQILLAQNVFGYFSYKQRRALWFCTLTDPMCGSCLISNPGKVMCFLHASHP